MCVAQLKREAAPTLPADVKSYRLYQNEAQELLEDELTMFFPGCVNVKGGGFHEGRVDGKLPPRFVGGTLVFQSRMTWVAAEVALRRPDRAQAYLVYARHGARFLQDVMWDKTNGGFYWAVDTYGKPAAPTGAIKHAYGMALAIQALAHVYAATGDEQYLKLAQDADQWLLSKGYDKKRGGYFQAFMPKGDIIVSAEETGEPKLKTDKIGTLYGCKSTMAHIHLLEAFDELYRVSPNAELRQRIRDMYDVTRDKAMLPTGMMGQNFLPTWTPLDRGGAFGLNLETGSVLLDTVKVLQIDKEPRSLGVVQKLVDTALERGWDDQLGGFWSTPDATDKTWRAQAEGARILLALYARAGDDSERYWTAFQKQWHFITLYMTDRQSHGWFPTVDTAGRPTSRNMIQSIKACDQTVRALMDVADTLGVLAGDTPAMPATRPRPTTKPVATTQP